MNSVVLRFIGLAPLGQAMERLRHQFPGLRLTYKTSTFLEAQGDGSALAKLQTLADWEVLQPTYAEIAPPLSDWSRFKDDVGS